MTERRKKVTYTAEFKQQMVSLYNSGKRKSDLIREYDLTASALGNRINRINATGSAKEADNRSIDEIKMIKLEKENQQLRMENNILKQAALIMGRK